MIGDKNVFILLPRLPNCGVLLQSTNIQDEVSPRMPYIIMSILAITTGFLVLLLPETVNMRLPETLEAGNTVTFCSKVNCICSTRHII